MKKIIFMFFILFFIKNAFAQNIQEHAQLAYCYGVYETIKSPAEVNKIKKMLLSVLDSEQNPYAFLTENEFYQAGKQKAKSLSKENQRQCFMLVYGFLSVIEMVQMPNQDVFNKDATYCLGYLGAVQEEGSFLMHLCSDLVCEQNPNADCVKKCYVELMQKAMKNSPRFAAGTNAATIADPAQVAACGMIILNIMNDEEKAKSLFISIWPELKDM